MSIKVLIVDDQENQRKILAEILTCEGTMIVFQAGNADDAIRMIKELQPQVVLTDLKMPGKNGIILLEDIRTMAIAPEVIVITAYSSIQSAIKATKLGAYDYITKPVKPEEVLVVIEKAYEKFNLRQESVSLRQELTNQVNSNLIARSSVMKLIVEMVETVAKTDSTVMVRGETGTGKECVARLIHLRSKRGSKPMRSINCAAFTETLLDSELFGYEKGAFTGAQSRKIGIIEAASGSTLFLDEIADMSQSSQAKILRAIQEKKIRRVGGTDDIPVDIRIIAATNKNLEQAVTNGTFRQDLFYRLNVVPIIIPPLRERKEDIPALVEHFLKRFGQHKSVDNEAMKLLCNYSWPGNVRELEAAVERIAVFSRNHSISIADLPAEISQYSDMQSHLNLDIPDGGFIFEDLEKSILSKALSRSKGNMAAAAKLLGMSYRAFRYRANSFGIRGE